MEYFRSMGVVCYYIGVSQNWKVVLLDKLKGAPGVLGGDRVKMGSITEYGRLNCEERSGRLASRIS